MIEEFSKIEEKKGRSDYWWNNAGDFHSYYNSKSGYSSQSSETTKGKQDRIQFPFYFLAELPFFRFHLDYANKLYIK